MDGGGHLVPLSYVYGYRGGIGRRRVGQDTTWDDVIKIRAQDGRYELSFYGAAQRVSCPNRPFPRWADVGQRKNGRSGENFLSETGCAWAILGGIPSGWGQFGAV